MGRTIAERLSEAAERSFVGRDAELGLLSEAIAADEPPFLVAYVHGPGGIGKSRLLQAAVRGAGPGVRAIALDCARIEPTSRGFLAALGGAIGIEAATPERVAGELGERVVLALDTYEAFGLMDTWLRQAFLPVLPETAVTLIASRTPPSPDWLTSPGWEGLFRQIELGSLEPEESRRMLATRGLSDDQAERVNRFARGHPLALELAAAALRTQPDLDIAAGPSPRVLQELTRAFLDGLAPEVSEAVEAASTLRVVTRPALEALLGPERGRAAFEELRELPFTQPTEHGLAMHDVVRDTVAADLAGRDPERELRYRRRAWRFLSSESQTTAGLNLWHQTADLLFQVRNPVIRGAFFPVGASELTVAPAAAADAGEVAQLAALTEPDGAARLLGRWWRAMPGAFHVARDAAGALAGFYLLFEPGDADAALLADDPVTAAWSEHMRRVPVAEGERVLFLRRWLGREAGETPAAGVAACFLDAKRAYMELRPHLRRLYTTVRDPEGFAYGAFRMFPLPETDAEVDGAAYHTLLIDFGEGSVDAWLTELVCVELGAEDDAGTTLPEGTVTIMFADIADSTALTERLGDEPFRAQARALDASLRALIGETGGAVVEGKLLGDGLLAVFSSARQAIDCAARSAAACGPSGLALHVGLHAGDVIREGGNVFGGAVNIAARVAGVAAPGEVLVSETVRSLARTSASVAFDDRGEHRLKGVDDTLRLYGVR